MMRFFDVFSSVFFFACATLIYRKILKCFLGVFFVLFFKYDLGMKKLVFLTLLSTAVSMLSGCANKDDISKVYLPFGKLYDSSLVHEGNLDIERNTKKITHSELTSLISKEENFALVVYEKDNTCACFKNFEEALNRYLYAFNTLIYSIDSSEFDGGHDVFGITVTKGESTICLFKGGVLEHQRVTNGSNDEFLEYTNLAKWMNERTTLSNMLYVSSTQLDLLFKGDCEFTVGFLRDSCSDCSYVKKNFLFEYNKKESNISYVIDCDEFEDDSFKSKYGLSEDSNPDYGYGQGYVPTFVRFSPTTTSNYSDSILDSCVYLNDKISLVDGTYKITQSFYTEERIPLLGFLGNVKNIESLLLGKTIDNSEIVEINGNVYWGKEFAAKYHNPLLQAFLDAYVSVKA